MSSALSRWIIFTRVSALYAAFSSILLSSKGITPVSKSNSLKNERFKIKLLVSNPLALYSQVPADIRDQRLQQYTTE